MVTLALWVAVTSFAWGAGQAPEGQSATPEVTHSKPLPRRGPPDAAAPQVNPDGLNAQTPAATPIPHALSAHPAVAKTGPLVSTGVASIPFTSLAWKQPINSDPIMEIVPLTNSGTGALGITSISTVLPFAESNDCGTSLAAGKTCNITVTVSTTQLCELDHEFLTIVSDTGTLTVDLIVYGADSTLNVTDLNNPTLTVPDLANTLLGSGVSVSNITYTGAPIAAGTFTGGANVIGFDSGIILSTGSANNVIGPNCTTGISGENDLPGDTDLSNQIGSTPTNDAAVLEFDFVPEASTLTFQYVFASDEYPEFVGEFNDVFAFFVNGTNVALVPGTELPVSINDVNGGNPLGTNAMNPQFYLNNNFQYPLVAPFDTEMDGLTVILTAQATVNPGVTNHIKLAIADAQDNLLDSNVFIKAASISSSQITLSPPTLGFGNQNVNSSSATQNVTVTNNGLTAVTISNISASGDFSQINNCPMSPSKLASTGTCSITVTFTPTTAGLRNGTITITDSAPGSSQTVSLTGTGATVPAPTITKNFGAGSVALNGTTTLNFTVANPAANATTLTGIGFTDTLPAGLVVASPSNGLSTTCTGGSISATAGSGSVSLSGISLAAGASCTLTVNVTGTTAGTKHNSVTVSSSGGATGNTSSASLSVASPPSITKAFGTSTIAVGGVTSLTFTINNPNGGSTVSGIAFTDNLPAGIAVATPNGLSGTCGGGTITAVAGSSAVSLAGASLSPSTSCTFSVNVTGTSVTEGAITNSVSVTSSDAGTGNTSHASLTVILAAAIVSPNTLMFGSQDINIPSTSQTVMLQNVSSSSLSITKISVMGTNPGDFKLGGTCGATLAAETTCQINVTFDPKATGSRSGTLQVTYNAPGSPQTVALTGTGVEPHAKVSVSSLSFQHNVNLACPPKPVTIHNTGTGPLLIQHITITGHFSQTNNCGTSLAPDASCEIDVTFTPPGIAKFDGTLTIDDNDATNPQEVSLSGQGLPPCALSSPLTTTQVLRSTASVNFTIDDNQPSCHTSTVTMACTNNAPATCVFSPPTISPGGSTALTVQNLSALPSDTFSFTVTGTDPTVTTSVGLVVLLSDFTFTPYPTTATVNAGQTANYAMTLTPVNGLTGSIQLSCQGAPSGSTCNVTPSTVSLAQNFPAQVSVAVNTAARSMGAPRGGAPLPGPGASLRLWLELASLLALIALAGWAATASRGGGAQQPSFAYRRLRLSGLILAALALMLMTWAACGGGGGMGSFSPNPGTPSGTYSLTVTGVYDSTGGQSTGLTRTQSLTLHVN